ncbi:tetratricopeptide repeat protein [Streptomyces sp. NPDC088400]|uniref:tetratricopeptide repeat protein n=1 Tax=Streptomyces sp. NPDC088400 TaxID=3365861 RepID=UPI0038155957
MARARLSMAELIQRRRRTGFIGRRDELGAFRANFDFPPDDERHRFLFHVHGNAGVGKTFLVRELEQAARERGALTAYVDESVSSVPEVLAAIGEQFARQGRPLKQLDRLLATYRQRRHEAESASASVSASLADPAEGGGMPGIEGPWPPGSLPPGSLPPGSLPPGSLPPGFGHPGSGQLVSAQLPGSGQQLPYGQPSYGSPPAGQPAYGHPSAGQQPLAVQPSAGSTALATAGVIGLGMIPVVGAFAGALDTQRLAAGGDRLRATLSARFRNQEDVQLVLAPDRVLTPVFVTELAEAARDVPWIVLFFDTYERTGPFLDAWLRDVMTTERYGALPAQAVVTLAGQRPFDTARWGGFADFMADVRLEPFTEPEARQLLAAKDVMDESVVEEVLRLSGGLPVLVSTLAENQPTDPDDVGDPSATAVERFLKWEQDPLRRATALACALPRRLDEDVFRAVVSAVVPAVVPEDAPDCAPAGLDGPADSARAGGLYDWLCALPFATRKDAGVRYHDVVRDPMLRLQRTRSPRGWSERHAALARCFADWRAEVEADLRADEMWASADWRALRFEETYHALCAGPRAALAGALRDVAEGCQESPAAARRAALVLAEAGEDTDEGELRDWGRRLGAALGDDDGGVRTALGLLLDRTGLDTPGRALAHEVRGRQLRNLGEYERALAEYGRSLALDPDQYRAYFGRGIAYRMSGDLTAALADLSRADELAPDTPWVLREYGDALRQTGRLEESVAVLDRAVALDPTVARFLASRGVARHRLGRYEEALADFDRALELDGEYLWALVRRSELLRGTGELDRSFADLDRAAEIGPDSAWIASVRGDAYRLAERYEDADRELGRALALKPDHASALAGRGVARHELGRHTEALADLDRAIELVPDYAWAMVHRASVRRAAFDGPGAMADLDRAVELLPDNAWVRDERGAARLLAGRHEDAIADFTAVLDGTPDDAWALAQRGMAAHGLHRFRDALADLDRAVELEPRYAWAHYCRALTVLAMGRLDRAHADLDRCLAYGGDVDHARRTVAAVRLLQGRPEEALRSLDALPSTEGDDLVMRCHALRRTGRWDAARAAADRLSAADPLKGAHARAMTVTLTEGADAGWPVWRRLERGWAQDAELPDDERTYRTVVSAAALADWSRLDDALDAVLMTEYRWDEIAELVCCLEELLSAPGIDTGRLRPRLARLVAARDEIAAHWA